MSNLPFFFPDDEVNLRMGKMLMLLNILSRSTKKEFLFNLERIAQFEFLTKHPILLNKILVEKDKEILALNNSEKYSIEAMFPNRIPLFDFTKIKTVLNVLMLYEFVDVKTGPDSQIYYIINEKGISQAEEFESIYFQRLEKILLQMKPLLNIPHSKINLIIQPYI